MIAGLPIHNLVQAAAQMLILACLGAILPAICHQSHEGCGRRGEPVPAQCRLSGDGRDALVGLVWRLILSSCGSRR
ncbi:MAG TPA: hypothetical protein VKB88_14105 [Bryobacteraceae bacterium]|nr:hypothetical protein [Bryobacteraceae bacterium]